MDTKIYRLVGIDTAMHLLRPGAKWEISNSVITKWDDPRPQPSMEEVREVMDKIQAFEDSINTDLATRADRRANRKKMIHNLFPTPVAIYKLERDLTAKELSFIKGQETRPNMGNKTSTNNTLLRSKEMTKLRDFIETKVAEYFKTVHNPKHNVSLTQLHSRGRTTQSRVSSIINTHTPTAFVSGVFYPQANRETDKIYFYRDGFQQIKFSPEDWNIWNSRVLVV
jgi:hypothetical protein